MEIHLIYNLPDNLADERGPGIYQQVAAAMAQHQHVVEGIQPIYMRFETHSSPQRPAFVVGDRVCRPRVMGDVATWRNILTGTVTRVDNKVNPTDPCRDGCGRSAGVHLDRIYYVHWDHMTMPGSYGYTEQHIKFWDGEHNPWPLNN